MTETKQTFALQGLDIEFDEEVATRPDGFAPFGIETMEDLMALIQRAIDEEWRASPAVLSGVNRKYPLHEDEPLIEHLAIGTPRAGLGTSIDVSDKKQGMIALWPFCSDGVQHTVEVDRLILNPNRAAAVVVGTLGGVLPVWFLDTEFAATRVYYIPGSVHDYVLTGFVHDFKVASAQPIELAAGSAGTEALRRILGENAPAEDDPVVVQTAGMSAFLPLGDPPDTGFEVIGPVLKVERYPLNILEQGCWKLRVTVCRLLADEVRESASSYHQIEEDEHGYAPINLDLILTDHVLAGRGVPEVGDDITAYIRLQGRVWIANVGSSKR